MSRRLSESTLKVYLWVARCPLSSAGDIVGILGLKQTAVSNILRRGEQAGLLKSACLGWEQRAVERYVVTSAGKAKFCLMPLFEGCPWINEWDIDLLAELGPFVERAYSLLPTLCQTNLFDGRVFVPRSRLTINTRFEPIEILEMEESDWRRARLVDLRWLPEGLEVSETALLHHTFSLIAVYENADPRDGRFYLPVAWKGRYQRQQEFQSLRSKMGELLELREDWDRISNVFLPRYCPGALFICSDRVSAIMARNRATESRPDASLRIGIVDLQGQVLQPLQLPSAWWESVKAPLPGGPYGEPELAMEDLAVGKTAVVTGKEQWRTFKTFADFPGIRPDQVPQVIGTSERKAGDLVRPMVKSKLVSKLDGGYYLDSAGRSTLASSERVSVLRVTRQLGVYTRKEQAPRLRRRQPRPRASGARSPGTYRRRQRSHNEALVRMHIALVTQGELAFPGKGRYIDYRGVRVIPDHYIILPTGVLAALEYEQSAVKDDDILKKALPYLKLAQAGRPMPVLFVTETEEAALKFIKLRQPHLLATTIARLEAGPQGKAVLELREGERIITGDPGCWGYWYNNCEEPTFDAPIDLWPAIESYPDWEVPADNPLRSV